MFQRFLFLGFSVFWFFCLISSKAFAADTVIKGTGNTSATASLEVTNSQDASLLCVRNDGNVGIGTTSPANKSKLDIVGAGGDFAQIRVGFSGTTRALWLGQVATTLYPYIGFNSRYQTSYYWRSPEAWGSSIRGWSDGIHIAADSGLSPETNYYPTTRVFIKNDGNVGIGTTTPMAKLDVRGNLLARAQFAIYNSDGVWHTDARPSKIIMPNVNGEFRFGYRTTGDGRYTPSLGFGYYSGETASSLPIIQARAFFGTADTNNRWQVSGMGKLEWGNGASAVDTNLFRDSANQLRTNDSLIVDGNVGIGTASPAANLHVKNSAIIEGSYLKIPVVTTDPATPQDGMLWYNSAEGSFKCRQNGQTKKFAMQ